jgi:hypothetical protein
MRSGLELFQPSTRGSAGAHLDAGSSVYLSQLVGNPLVISPCAPDPIYVERVPSSIGYHQLDHRMENEVRDFRSPQVSSPQRVG